METRTVRGIELAFDKAGEGDLIILIHGVGADRTAWKYQLNAFADEGYTVVAVDLRGSGDSQSRQSDGNVVPINRTEFAEDVHALIGELGFTKAHWIGNSLGGIVIQQAIALGFPSVDKIVLSNSFACYPDSVLHLARASSALREKSLQEFARIRIPQVLKPDIDKETLEEALYAMARKDPEAYLASWAATWSADFRTLLPTIDHPTLVVSSTLDTITPVALSKELAKNIPRAKHITIKSAGHISNLDQPNDFNQTVLSFLAA
jgi:3-oxoadipate enol-lactonase